MILILEMRSPFLIFCLLRFDSYVLSWTRIIDDMSISYLRISQYDNQMDFQDFILKFPILIQMASRYALNLYARKCCGRWIIVVLQLCFIMEVFSLYTCVIMKNSCLSLSHFHYRYIISH